MLPLDIYSRRYCSSLKAEQVSAILLSNGRSNGISNYGAEVIIAAVANSTMPIAAVVTKKIPDTW